MSSCGKAVLFWLHMLINPTAVALVIAAYAIAIRWVNGVGGGGADYLPVALPVPLQRVCEAALVNGQSKVRPSCRAGGCQLQGSEGVHWRVMIVARCRDWSTHKRLPKAFIPLPACPPQ